MAAVDTIDRKRRGGVHESLDKTSAMRRRLVKFHHKTSNSVTKTKSKGGEDHRATSTNKRMAMASLAEAWARLRTSFTIPKTMMMITGSTTRKRKVRIRILSGRATTDLLASIARREKVNQLWMMTKRAIPVPMRAKLNE